ncbi:Uncharacterised protein [Klebsiella pneumoniae]|nr:Uncharacterised protein [Klebsiella pneumoniae]
MLLVERLIAVLKAQGVLKLNGFLLNLRMGFLLQQLVSKVKVYHHLRLMYVPQAGDLQVHLIQLGNQLLEQPR